MLLGRDAAPASVVRSHVPGRHSGSLTGALRPRQVRQAVKGESPDAACGASVGETHLSRAASGPLITGCPEKPGPVWQNPDHASSRRAIPLAWGTEKESKDGRPPTPKQTTGASMALANRMKTGSTAREPRRESPSPGEGGSRAKRAGWGERKAQSRHSPHPDRLRSASAVDPPPPGEGGHRVRGTIETER
jgi:hypothetical protein